MTKGGIGTGHRTWSPFMEGEMRKDRYIHLDHTQNPILFHSRWNIMIMLWDYGHGNLTTSSRPGQRYHFGSNHENKILTSICIMRRFE